MRYLRVMTKCDFCSKSVPTNRGKLVCKSRTKDECKFAIDEFKATIGYNPKEK